MTDFDDLLEKAKDIARGAGSILIEQKKTHTIQTIKNAMGTDFATSADYASEKYIVGQIQRYFPSHSIFTEEGQHTFEKKGAEFEWIIDPLDCTRDYSRGSSNYYVLLGIEQNKVPIAGVVYCPEANKIYAARKGGNFMNDDVPAHVSSVSALEKSIVITRLPIGACTDSELDSFQRIEKALIKNTFRTRAYSCDIVSCVAVADGQADGYVLPTHLAHFKGPKWWDIAPAFAIIESAHGKVTDFNGNPIKNRDLSNGLIASNTLLHPFLLDLVQKNR